jgi:hypothetical protein
MKKRSVKIENRPGHSYSVVKFRKDGVGVSVGLTKSKAEAKRIKEMTQYRARGHYKRTNRDSWVTTVWRFSEKEAHDDIRMFAPATFRDYSKTWVVKRER